MQPVALQICLTDTQTASNQKVKAAALQGFFANHITSETDILFDP